MDISLFGYSLQLKWSHAIAVFFPLFLFGLAAAIGNFILSSSLIFSFSWLLAVLVPFAAFVTAKTLKYEFQKDDFVSMALIATVLPTLISIGALALYEYSTPDSSLYYGKPRTPFGLSAAASLLTLPLGAFLTFAGLFLAFNLDKKKIMANLRKTLFAVLIAMVLSNATAYLAGSQGGYVQIDEYGITSIDYGAVFKSLLYYGFFFLAALTFLKSGANRAVPAVGTLIYLSFVLGFVLGTLALSTFVLYIVLGVFLIILSNPKLARQLAL